MNVPDEKISTGDNQRPKPTHLGFVETPKGKVNEQWIYFDGAHWINEQGRKFNPASGEMLDQPGYAWRSLDLASVKELTAEKIAERQKLDSFFEFMDESGNENLEIHD